MTDKLIADFPTVDFWRSLRYFNLYRLALASLFVFLAGTFGPSLSLGERNWTVFFVASLIYAVVVMLSFIPLRLHWPRFAWQLAGQVGGDIVGLSVLSYASGGIQSSIGLLLMIEGVLPFAAPAEWRGGLRRRLQLSDGQLRFIGAASMLGGVFLLMMLN